MITLPLVLSLTWSLFVPLTCAKNQSTPLLPYSKSMAVSVWTLLALRAYVWP